MDGLKGARVVVVDDSHESAVPLLLALGQEGIGAAYLDGQPEHLPAAPFRGVRILFLDMDLGVGGEDTAIIGALIGVLRKVLRDDTHPLGIVTWTVKDDAFVDRFESAFRDAFPGIRPLMLQRLTKTDELPVILKELPERLKTFGAFNFLLFWEQLVAQAASDTTAALSELVEGDQIDEALLDLLSLVARAGAGPEVTTAADGLRASLDGLNVILEDRLMRLSQEAASATGTLDAVVAAATEKLTTQGATSEAYMSGLNRLLLIAPVVQGHAPRPGNLYLPDGYGDAFPIGVDGDSAIGLDDLIIHMCRLADGPPKVRAKQLDELRESAIPVLLELTPDCDYAQNRMSRARLVGGLMLPLVLAKKLNGRDYVKEIGPFAIAPGDCGERNGIYVLAIDALIWLGIPVAELSERHESLRLRKQQLVDVQAWFGGHAVRPGVIQIDR